jgi:hypothetical protein
LSGPDSRRGGLAVVITADEDDRHSGNNVLTVVAAPGLTGKVVTAALTHYSLTGLYDDVIGAAKLRDAAAAPSFAPALGLAVGRAVGPGHRWGTAVRRCDTVDLVNGRRSARHALGSAAARARRMSAGTHHTVT